MNRERDYTTRTFLIALLVLCLLLGISQIPKFRVGEVSLKKINILSDLVNDDFYPSPEGNLYFDTTFLAEGEALEAEAKAQLEAQNQADTVVIPQPDTQPIAGTSVVPDSLVPAKILTERSNTDRTIAQVSQHSLAAKTPEIAFLEDFGTEGRAMSHFYNMLADPDRKHPIRIAVLGDSFIEGDIVTADIREQLQDLYGGRGVGFVSFATPIAQFRGTIQHTFNGWNVLDVKQARQASADLQDKFFVSGNLCIPGESASVQMKGVSFRKHIYRADVAKLIFMNRQNTSILVTINDTIQQVYTPEPSPNVQQIELRGPIHALQISLTQTDGFIGYGVVFEDENGVSVDNFSIRGNSSLALFGTNSGVNEQIGQMRRYDLVVLEYGLNVMSQDVLHYGSYSKAFVKVINYMKRCFPGSSILVMGICDRSMQRDGEFVTMPSVLGMIEAQRRAAQETGVAFWNTFEAMGGTNSMADFVKKNWAAKDYTHIGYAGGKFIANKLIKSFLQGAEIEKQRQQEEAKQQEVESFHYNRTDSSQTIAQSE